LITPLYDPPAILILSLLAGSALAEPESFPLVAGNRQAIIVGRADTLVQGIERCTGVKLEQVPEARYQPQANRFPIFVGDTEKARQLLADDIADLDAEGYIVLVKPEFAILYAKKSSTDTGNPISWAQGDFLRRFLGVDWFLPGELGEHFPTHETVLISPGKWVANPAFKHRHWSGYVGKAGPSWRVRASGGGGRYRYHHNLFKIINPKLHSDHPEYFPVIIAKGDTETEGRGVHRPLKPGQRFVPPENLTTYWQPCTTNPKVVELTVQATLKHFSENPGSDSFSLGVNDSGGYCLCESCLAESPEGVDPASDEANGYRFYRYYNKVAERVANTHPDVRLGFLVYGDLTDWYPEKLHPLLMPYLTMSMADRWDEAYRERQNEHIQRWSGIASQFGIYEWLYGSGFLIPRIYLREFADGLRQAHAAGAEGFYAEAYANWAMDGPKLWVAEQLLWNPDEDVDALLDRWHEGMFAEAAQPMRAYFDYLEEAWRTQQPSDDRRGGYRLLGAQFKGQQFTDVFSPEKCDRAWQLLETAERAADNELVRKRITYFKTAFGATRLASNRYASAVALDAMLKQEDRETISLTQWFERLEDWQRFGPLDLYMEQLREDAPYAFHAFSQAQYVKNFRPSFRDFDTNTMALPHIMHQVIAEARKGPSIPVNARELLASSHAVLEGVVDFPHSNRLVRNHVSNAVMTVEPMAGEPGLDGEIEPAWGEPFFDGELVRYPYFDQRDTRRTRIWFRHHGNRFYAAFRCEQDMESLADSCKNRDEVVLNEKGIVKPGDGARDFPYLLGNDVVGLVLPGRQVVIVTAGGGIFDASSSAYGYRADWNGGEAKVARQADGWSAEIAIDLGEQAEALLRQTGPIHGFNFFRVTGNVRYAWTPATPRRWSIHTGNTGYGFLEQDLRPDP
jgi:hypothetical protein